jgi:hypothetical protein
MEPIWAGRDASRHGAQIGRVAEIAISISAANLSYRTRPKSLRQSRRLAFCRPVAARAGHAGGTAGALVRAIPRPARMLFAHPATALHLGAKRSYLHHSEDPRR